MRIKLLTALCILATFSCHANEEAVEKPPFRLSGWREVIVSVSDLAQHTLFFQQLAGWEQRYNGRLNRKQLSGWNLGQNAQGTEILVANKGSNTGYIRLVQFHDVEQQQIRSNDQSWDSGGILDINVRVTDMQKKFKQLQAQDWQADSDPVSFEFGPFSVTEWITRGPDGLSFALIERHKPALEGWPNLKELSRAFNSTQVVADMEPSRHFYMDVLGFKKYLYHKGASKNPSPNVLGIPINLSTEIKREVWVLHPQGINEGSVELLAFEGLQGRDFYDSSNPPNLGNLMLRFPVRGIGALATHLALNGIALENPISTLEMPPYGKVKRFAVRAPNGTWLEFFEEVGLK